MNKNSWAIDQSGIKGADTLVWANLARWPGSVCLVKTYYETFTGMLGSYVYVNDNLVFQTSVSMPKELASQYQEVFESLGN